MINFSTFNLDALAKTMYSLREYTQDNLRYPKAGELIEIAYDVCSNGQLRRVNQPGIDLVGADGKTYESKVTQFRNKSKRAVRSVILKNSRSQGFVSHALADYFIFTDIKLGKACCVPSNELYKINFNGATLKAHADPHESTFFLHQYLDVEDLEDYFINEEAFRYNFVRSFL
jgi:hypothetical protein